jgi:hypothetical protein
MKPAMSRMQAEAYHAEGIVGVQLRLRGPREAYITTCA